MGRRIIPVPIPHPEDRCPPAASVARHQALPFQEPGFTGQGVRHELLDVSIGKDKADIEPALRNERRAIFILSRGIKVNL